MISPNLYFLFIGPVSTSHWGIGLQYKNFWQDTIQSLSELFAKYVRSYYRFHKLVMFDFTFLRAVQTHFTLIDNLCLLKLFAKIVFCIIYYMIRIFPNSS